MISRRKFLQISSLATAGIIIPKHLRGLTCDKTTADLMGLGPFWEPNSPYRISLASPEEPGIRLFLSGMVTANDCQTPIPNVIVDAWHANDTGCYSVFQTCDTGNPANDEFNLRGRVLSNSNGLYLIETIKPGFYPLGLDIFRPSHIHFIITPPGGESLVTQLYFLGDPYIDEDNGSSDPNAHHRIIPLVETENGLEGFFKINLDIEPEERVVNTIRPEDYNNRIQNVKTFPNPFNSKIKVQFTLVETAHVLVSVYDLNGQWIQTLNDSILSNGSHGLVWNGINSQGHSVPSGEYFVSIQSPFGHQMEKITFLK